MIDTLSLVLRAVEALSFEERGPLFERVCAALLAALEREPRYEIITCELIDQLIEVARSKDLLATNAYRAYCEREELELRARLRVSR